MKISMKAAASWLGRVISLRHPGFWRYYASTTNYSGKSVSAQTALQLDVVWACVKLISQLVATLPLSVYEKKDGRRRSASEHWLHKVIAAAPNADMTAADFWESLLTSILLWGNAYALIVRNGAGKIIALEPLRPERMAPKLQRDGSMLFVYVDQNGHRFEYSELEILHLKGFTLDGRMGLSPISYARHTLGAAMAQEETAATIFKNGLRPSGYVTTDQVLTKSNREEVRESVVTQVASGSESGRTLVLEAGMKYAPVAMNPEDAQLLQSRAFSIEQLCRWMCNVPPVLIGHAAQGQTMWGSGVEQLLMGWKVTGLNPLIIKIEQALNGLFPANERDRYYVKFSLQALLRADAKGRAALYSSGLQNAYHSPNEIIELEDGEPYEGGDRHFVQANLVPVDQIGKEDATQGKAREALLNWLGRPKQETHDET
ncbi:phage portal protein [Achromobacter mucicolens]|uniref:phage portal protein n=1 Tax=Achromobacter mucicolens TaxID=1389922 RepID=UPI00244CE37B|nr:phage portal protein [Achromobacter mucicolens]MDH0092760.1 phage portal protein [Achromobacter mucicolens]